MAKWAAYARLRGKFYDGGFDVSKEGYVSDDGGATADSGCG